LKKKDNIHFLKLYTLSESDGKEFKNEEDNIYLDNILKSYYKFRDKMNIFNKIIEKIINIIKNILKCTI
jgi:hypothetical protein